MTNPTYACNLNAFTREERTRYAHLTRELEGAVLERTELESGFALRLLVEKLSPGETAEWITLERKCCPFVEFNLVFEPNLGPVWLQLRGGPEVKAILRHELSSLLG